MFTTIKNYCDNLTSEFDLISTERKLILDKISNYIQKKKDEKKEINLVYICTHNSRRSHFGQVWSAVAAKYYTIENVKTFSGGTEATAFNANAIHALKKIGFNINSTSEEKNPHYKVYFAESNYTICFSKTFDSETNPTSNFAAIMTCSDAEENCPFIAGAELRIATTYKDPKAFDNTQNQEAAYDERCKQIAHETLYIFSKIK